MASRRSRSFLFCSANFSSTLCAKSLWSSLSLPGPHCPSLIFLRGRSWLVGAWLPGAGSVALLVALLDTVWLNWVEGSAGTAGTVAAGCAFCSTFDTALGRLYLDMLRTGASFFCSLAAANAATCSFCADSSAAARLTDRYRVYLGWTVVNSTSVSWDMLGVWTVLVLA